MAVLFIAIPLKAYNKGNRSSLFSSPLSYKVNTTSLGTYDMYGGNNEAGIAWQSPETFTSTAWWLRASAVLPPLLMCRGIRDRFWGASALHLCFLSFITGWEGWNISPSRGFINDVLRNIRNYQKLTVSCFDFLISHFLSHFPILSAVCKNWNPEPKCDNIPQIHHLGFINLQRETYLTYLEHLC